jgi:hypothetical protein
MPIAQFLKRSMAAKTASSLWKKRIDFETGPFAGCILPAGDRMDYPTTGGVQPCLWSFHPPEPLGRRTRLQKAHSRQNRAGRHFANGAKFKTLSQVDTFFKLILFFLNIPLQFRKTWFISFSLFLLAFSRCSRYNRLVQRVENPGI